MSSASIARSPAGKTERSGASILVIGLGNPVRGDDGVGWRVIEAVEDRLEAMGATGRPVGVELDRLAVGGLSLMERLVGYERAILVDALEEGVTPGTVSHRSLDELTGGPTAHLDSSHDASLAAALAAGSALGATLPSDITVVGVEIRDADVFSDQLSPAVEAAVPAAVELLMGLLRPAAAEAAGSG
ncbi:MAG: hydrogenase maturation protease [Acidimicrobiales bacterium]